MTSAGLHIVVSYHDVLSVQSPTSDLRFVSVDPFRTYNTDPFSHSDSAEHLVCNYRCRIEYRTVRRRLRPVRQTGVVNRTTAESVDNAARRYFIRASFDRFVWLFYFILDFELESSIVTPLRKPIIQATDSL